MGEQLKERLKGKVSISRRSSLLLDGDVCLNSSLDLDGALSVSGQGALGPQVVRNGGQLLEAIPDAQLASQPPALQIRGYRQAPGTIKEIRVEGVNQAPGAVNEIRVE